MEREKAIAKTVLAAVCRLGNLARRFLKYAIFGLLILLVALLVAGGVYLWQFSRGSGLGVITIGRQIYKGVKRPYRSRYYHLLVLGVDKRPDNPTYLTDTILLLTVDTQTGNYMFFSLPRDLWVERWHSKINALYFYGRQKDARHPFKLIKSTLKEITGEPIQNVILLSMNNVRRLIDLVGGVDVYVRRSFTDHYFPRDDGSGRVKTVAFEKGWRHFDGQRALEYLRSRKSQDPEEGNDLARERRQQEVILALEKKLEQPNLILKYPYLMGQLYQFVQQNIIIEPPLNLQALASWWPWLPRLIKGRGEKIVLPWQGKEAIVKPGYDPYYGSWILQPKNDDWQLIHNFFEQAKAKL